MATVLPNTSKTPSRQRLKQFDKPEAYNKLRTTPENGVPLLGGAHHGLSTRHRDRSRGQCLNMRIASPLSSASTGIPRMSPIEMTSCCSSQTSYAQTPRQGSRCRPEGQHSTSSWTICPQNQKLPIRSTGSAGLPGSPSSAPPRTVSETPSLTSPADAISKLPLAPGRLRSRQRPQQTQSAPPTFSDSLARSFDH